jgi:hypothetical protein
MFLIFLSLFISCSFPAAKSVEPSSEPIEKLEEGAACSKYSGLSYQYCLFRYVQNIQYPESINYCAKLGEWEEECRYEWMKENKKRKTKKELLSVCQSAPDCRFEVLNSFPASTLEDQLQECMTITQENYKQDCIKFVLLRIWSRGFNKEEISIFTKLYQSHNGLLIINQFAGILQECTNDFTCTPSCTRSAEKIKKQGCPLKKKPKPWVWTNKFHDIRHPSMKPK